MSEYDHRGVTPLKIVAALVALGMTDRRGQRVLALIRRVTKWGLVLCVLGFSLSLQADDDSAKFGRLGGLLGALVCSRSGATWRSPSGSRGDR